jgi:exopolysaccharide biosynthesis protein
MKNKKNMVRRNLWKPIATSALTIYTAITMLTTFVLPSQTVTLTEAKKQSSPTASTTASNNASSNTSSDASSNTSTESSSKTSDAIITENSYKSDGLTITISEKTVDKTEVYIADIVTDDPSTLLSGLANDTFGRNVTATTSSIAESCNAILAINGDFYGFRSTGYVMRNGYLYRDSASSDEDQEDLVIYQDGSMDIVKESDVSAKELSDDGAVQIYSFGPGLVEDGKITVNSSDEVGQSMRSNPRTAIGMIETGHYVMVVSDGRTSESQGLSLEELAEVMQDLGCTEAYNLDGGGSSTMYFNGRVINKPTTNGNRISERKVSDIVYIKAS